MIPSMGLAMDCTFLVATVLQYVPPGIVAITVKFPGGKLAFRTVVPWPELIVGPGGEKVQLAATGEK
jgi:hypothetical protein